MIDEFDFAEREAPFDPLGVMLFKALQVIAFLFFIALLPLGIGITGHGGFISQPLAIIVIGGLVSSTLLTLIVLPTLYYVVEGARERKLDRLREKRDGVDTSIEPPRHNPPHAHLAE